MADPLAPTDPDVPRDDAGDGPATRAEAPTVELRGGRHVSAAPAALVRGAPEADPLERAVLKARAAAALFGEADAVKVGRYRLIERAGAGGMGVVWSAWDPELNRGVALKLASAGGAAARARALDEGRALARLSHPNVVPIYDVLEAPEGVFLVMELVKGKTLRTVATDGASAAELVRAYRQCGDGLAAAHRAGLIHRDFKPDNAILGADGRVRVLDFGLAHAVADDDGAPVIAGTPRYMAPEQKRGDALTAAVDQYALCASLREAVAARGATPRWLEPILTRGTAADAAARFPSMDALLAALARDPAARWRRRGLVAAGAITAGAVAVAVTASRAAAPPSPCEGGPAAVAAAWGGARRADARAHLGALIGGYAGESVPRVVDALDRYAGSWVDLHRASCQAHQRGEVSTAAYDRRVACLARRKAALAAVAEVAGQAEVGALPDLVIAASGLPDLAVCGDDDALLSPVAPPTAAQAPEAAAIADLIARVDVERDAARIDDATRDAAAAVARAEALGYAPLLARARLARGRIALTLSRGDNGLADFAAATTTALEAGDEPLAIEAYARAAFTIGIGASNADATAGLPLIEAMTRRLGDRAAFPRALLHHNVATVELARGDRGKALDLLRLARSEAAPLTGSAAIEMQVVLQSLLLTVDDALERAQLGAELVTTRARALGPNHPLTLEADIMRAGLIADREQGRRALEAPCASLASLHATQRAMIRECGFELTWRAAAVDDLHATERWAGVVLGASRPADTSDLIDLARAYRALASGDAPGALARLDSIREVDGVDAPWWRRLSAVDVEIARALTAQRLGRAQRARDALARAEVIAQAIAAAAPILVGHRLETIAQLRTPRP